MKIYEVRTMKLTYDWGRFDGYRHIAYTVNEDRAKEIAKETAEKMKLIPQWWIDNGKRDDGEPYVDVVELGEVTE